MVGEGLPLPPPPVLAPRNQPRADDDPPWVWTTARWTAAVLLAVPGLLLTAMVVGVFVDVRAVSSPDRTNDDGSGLFLWFALYVIVALVPLLAVAILSLVLAVLRVRAALYLNAVIGVVGMLIALSAVPDNTTAWLFLLALSVVAGSAIASITASAQARARAGSARR